MVVSLTRGSPFSFKTLPVTLKRSQKAAQTTLSHLSVLSFLIYFKCIGRISSPESLNQEPNPH